MPPKPLIKPRNRIQSMSNLPTSDSTSAASAATMTTIHDGEDYQQRSRTWSNDSLRLWQSEQNPCYTTQSRSASRRYETHRHNLDHAEFSLSEDSGSRASVMSEGATLLVDGYDLLQYHYDTDDSTLTREDCLDDNIASSNTVKRLQKPSPKPRKAKSFDAFGEEEEGSNNNNSSSNNNRSSGLYGNIGSNGIARNMLLTTSSSKKSYSTNDLSVWDRNGSQESMTGDHTISSRPIAVPVIHERGDFGQQNGRGFLPDDADFRPSSDPNNTTSVAMTTTATAAATSAAHAVGVRSLFSQQSVADNPTYIRSPPMYQHHMLVVNEQ